MTCFHSYPCERLLAINNIVPFPFRRIRLDPTRISNDLLFVDPVSFMLACANQGNNVPHLFVLLENPGQFAIFGAVFGIKITRRGDYGERQSGADRRRLKFLRTPIKGMRVRRVPLTFKRHRNFAQPRGNK